MENSISKWIKDFTDIATTMNDVEIGIAASCLNGKLATTNVRITASTNDLVTPKECIEIVDFFVATYVHKNNNHLAMFELVFYCLVQIFKDNPDYEFNVPSKAYLEITTMDLWDLNNHLAGGDVSFTNPFLRLFKNSLFNRAYGENTHCFRNARHCMERRLMEDYPIGHEPTFSLNDTCASFKESSTDILSMLYFGTLRNQDDVNHRLTKILLDSVYDGLIDVLNFNWTNPSSKFKKAKNTILISNNSCHYEDKEVLEVVNRFIEYHTFIEPTKFATIMAYIFDYHEIEEVLLND